MNRSGCLWGALHPCLKPAGWEFQSDYTTKPAAAQNQLHIRHKQALVAGNDRGVRAEGMFDLERA